MGCPNTNTDTNTNTNTNTNTYTNTDTNTDLVSSSGSSRVLLIKGGGWVGHQATGPNAAQTELDSL